MRILVVSTALPFPPVSGGGLRTYHVTRALAARHDLTLVGFSYAGETVTPPDFPLALRAVAWQTPPLYAAMQGGDEKVAAEAFATLDRTLEEPWISSYYESPAMTRVLAEEAREGYDLTLFLGSDAARFMPVFPAGAPMALDFMDVLTHMAMRVATTSPDPERARREAERTRRWESRIAARATLAFACSADEAAAAEELLSVGGVAVIPNGVDTQRFAPPQAKPDSQRLLFTGYMAYEPNRDAVRFFVSEVMPRLAAARCDARLDVLGARSQETLGDLASPAVSIHGLVPDTLPFQHAAAIVVAPILVGGGTRLKILEAAACGNAIVSTTLGAEGLGFRDGVEIAIADTPDQMSFAIRELLASPARRLEMGRRARQAALRYDWRAIEADLCDLVDCRFRNRRAAP